MKKIIFIVLLLAVMSTQFFSQDITIKDIEAPEELQGTNYFPLFVGAKWIWDIKGMGNVTKINWELISAHKITDIKNNIEDATAFKLKISFKIEEQDMVDEQYVFEYEDYICFYRKVANEYRVEKVIPVDPVIDNKWEIDSTTYKVVEKEDNTVKIESIDEELDRYGYQMFIKDVGPYEIFEYYSSGEKKEDMMMTLVDSASYEDVYKMTKEEPEKTKELSEEKSETPKDQDTIKENKKEPDLSDADYIKSLSKDKKYLQIGAFNIVYYAEDQVRKAKKSGFAAKIYQDIDGFYKVLIEVTDENDIKNVKEKITKDAFIKK